MAEITTTQAFSDGDTVTATKLNNITANAAIQTEAITNRSAETTVDQANDLLLMYDASATALKKISLSNVIKAGTASNFPVTGNATVGGTLGVTGASTLSSTLGVSDTISATKGSGTGLAVTSNATIGGTLGVSGASTLANTAVLGTLGVSDTISATKSTGTGLAVTNNATVGGTLAVTGAITASSTVNGTTIPTSKTLVTTDDTQTLTGKTVNLASNTLAGTLAQFNTSCSDANFASLAGSETLTNKTLTSPVISGGTINNAVIGGTTAAAGSFTTLSATSPITTQAGTAASPAIVPTGDTNTGIFFPAADTIAFSEGGTESMRINSSGNVGIGTASPSVKLEVAGSTKIGSGNDYQFDSTLKISGESTGATGYLRFYTNSTERLRIDSSGNIGIGASNPTRLLQITGSSGVPVLNVNAFDVLSWDNVNQLNLGGITASQWQAIKLYTGGSERLRIDSSGRVGIGTNSPLKELQINATEPTIRLEENSAGSKRLEISVNSSAEAKIFANQSAGTLILGTAGSERLRIGSVGQIGIGGANYGTSGQVLTSNGSGSAPSWQANTPADGTITYAKLSTSATEADNVSKRVAKAWVNFNGTGTVAIRDDFNVSSVTDEGTGDYTINFVTTISNSNYCVLSSGASVNPSSSDLYSFGVRAATAPTTSSVRMIVKQFGSSLVDATYLNMAVFSS